MIQLEECPKDELFDGQSCVPNGNFSCSENIGDTCIEKPDGYHSSEDASCRGFYFCRHEQLIRSYKCSNGFVFNGEECVSDENYICTVRPKLPDCTNKIDGYYTVDKSNCKSFLYCRSGLNVAEHSCPGSYVFNGDQCVDESLYQCPDDQVINNINVKKP